ncbi:recombinase family protein [Salipaludibacillus sp. CF4.18]|uniref:recombinase family protein n=1 Tax=Salipaludibacillus sp. CF4.18 TaxID=3373081 RepID=UPI003EE7CCD6
MGKVKVAVYTRVSTTHKDQLTSFENQADYYRKYCDRKGYNLFNLYADKGLSATSPKRKRFLDMLEDSGLDVNKNPNTGKLTFDISSREPKFKYIICKDPSRFARNIDAMSIAKMLEEKKVYLVFENADFTTEMSDWEMRLSMMLVFTQQESLDRSKKVSWSYLQRADKGIFHMSRPLYGYVYDEESKGYVINEDEAIIIRKIFDMYVNKNMGCRIIADELRNKNIPTRSGIDWRADAIRRIVTNEKYKGQLVANRYGKTSVTSSNRRIIKDRSEWIVKDDVIPAIVDKELFDKVDILMKDRTNQNGNKNKYGAKIVQNVFHQKIQCGKCGSDFIRVSGSKVRGGEKITEYNYFCKNRRHYKSCDMRGISHGVLMRLMDKFMEGELHELININMNKEKKYSAMIFEELNNKRENAEKIISEIDEKIEKLENEINSLVKGFLSGNQDKTVVDIMSEQVKKLGEDKKQLESEKLQYDLLEIEKVEDEMKGKLLQMEKLSKKKTFTFDETLNQIISITKTKSREVEVSIQAPTVIIYALQGGDLATQYTQKFFKYPY